jgi:hypothetical protein
MQSYSNPTPPYPDTQTEEGRVKCDWCGAVKPRAEFYTRSGMPHLIHQGCKECRKAVERVKKGVPRNNHATFTPSEAWVIERLKSQGIPALPGKALHYADADVVAFGCVLIEVKSSLKKAFGFQFGFTPKQHQERIKGEIIVLVCNYGDHKTFHVFDADAPFFYNVNGTRKTGVSFVPGTEYPVRHKKRAILTQSLMDEAHERWSMVWSALKVKSDGLRLEALIQSGDPFGGKADFGL